MNREEAIGILSARSKILKNSKKTGKHPAAKALDIAIEALKERPKGRWVHDYNNVYGCSHCLKRENMSPKHLKAYCPNCGAEMRGEEE